jgi:16S rRNA (adenine1518-N6/adenine1519-N6)-dimethyltransferase
VLNVDALANKHTLNPILIDQIRSGIASSPGKVFKLVANLPYSIATPIITNLLVHPEVHPARMVVTIQYELAERMTAPPGTSAYGALSVLMQALAEVSIVRVLPPTVFWPRPKVDSAVVSIVPDPARQAALDVAWFHEIVRRLFLHRRKNLRHVLAGIWQAEWTKTEVGIWLEGLGIDGRLRAEALDVDRFRSLASALKSRWHGISAETPGTDLDDGDPSSEHETTL